MLGLQGSGHRNQKQQAQQHLFRADPNGYILRVMTSENGQSINPPERLAPIVRADPMSNRMRVAKMELPNSDLQLFSKRCRCMENLEFFLVRMDKILKLSNITDF